MWGIEFQVLPIYPIRSIGYSLNVDTARITNSLDAAVRQRPGRPG
jgi:hypothetical protein